MLHITGIVLGCHYQPEFDPIPSCLKFELVKSVGMFSHKLNSGTVHNTLLLNIRIAQNPITYIKYQINFQFNFSSHPVSPLFKHMVSLACAVFHSLVKLVKL